MPMYLCESSGARVLAYGSGVSQLGTEYQMDLETWDEIPAGEAGDCYFRGVNVTIEHDNGFSVGITPVVDGVEQSEQTFTGSGTGITVLQAHIAVRGARVAVHVRTISRAGSLDVQNVEVAYLPLRAHP